MRPLVEPLLEWFRSHPSVGTLCFLMIADVCMGLMVAWADKTVNSSVSRVGMFRKVGTALLVGTAYTIEPHAQGVPLGLLTSLAFVVTELISVTENAARLGIPVPQPLIDVLSKLRGERAAPITVRLEQPGEKDTP